MHRTIAVVAALCVLSSMAIAPIAADAPGVAGAAIPMDGNQPRAIGSGNAVLATAGNDTTAYLAIAPENVQNATTTRAALDVGGALAADAAATSEAMGALTLDEHLSQANTTTAKQAVIEREGTRIERRISGLRAGQRATIEAYSDDNISTREFVDVLSRTQVRAEGLRRAVDRLESAAQSVPGAAIGGESVDSWARDRRVALGIVTSPLRERIVAAFRGTGPMTVFVEVGDTGVVLAATDRGQYLRDVYLPSERANGPPNGLDSTSAAFDRATTLYPWAWNHSTGVESAGGPAAGSYRITIFHQQGRLTTHLDPGTGNVFRELQVKRLDGLTTAPAVDASDDGLEMHVRRTYPTGPMNVSVVDSRTTEPVNASVIVDDRSVGRTDSEGYLWTVAPRGALNMTVTEGDRVVTARFASDPRSPDASERRPSGESGLVTPSTNESTGGENATTATNTSASRTVAGEVTTSSGSRSPPPSDLGSVP